jgi:hypothetical protein
MNITIKPFTTLDALVQYRKDHDLLYGPFPPERLLAESTSALEIVADLAVAEAIRHVHNVADGLRKVRGEK